MRPQAGQPGFGVRQSSGAFDGLRNHPLHSSILADGLLNNWFGNMRCAWILAWSVFLAGCAKYDPRLHGTWQSNRDETVAAAFQRDSRWTNAPPEKVVRFKDMFGHMTVAYFKDRIRAQDREKQWTMRYRIVEQGEDYVVIRTRGGGLKDGLQMRIRFVDAGNGYWMDSGKLLGSETPEEKFDKVAEPGASASRRQPVGSEANRSSSRAGPDP